ncbi:hypothetical protein BFR38_10080 [Brochothrix thermosphacta]|uniref:bacterial Ig-like domain-containing protein n=1 Tax=Brochothrix thermosphacta TaxID=2756 RepID=UPI00083FACDE|nr:bacterial Ig-like domain-containing protein [Brochothrix thermosphacta]ODJ54571.1 hypothetical protein BFR38_10080 [Brochothrix thermosphacta]ODJ61081.1 hypothetical protein BFR42_09925 [Brochothrix thermosphacta]
MLKKLFLIIMIGLLLQPNIYLANASTLEKTTVLNEQEQQKVENKDESQAKTSLTDYGKTINNKAEKPSTRAIEWTEEFDWSIQGFNIYAKSWLIYEYNQDITFQTKDATLGLNVGDTLEGYVDLSLTAIVDYKQATMFYGNKFMSDNIPGMYHNNVEFDFNLKAADSSAFEVKVVNVDFPDNVNPPSNTIGNKAKFYIKIKRLKKTVGKELEIPTKLTWKTSYFLQNGLTQHYIRNWEGFSYDKTYKIPLETEPTIETKDSVLYSTQSYNPKNNFVGGTDIDYNALKWDEKTMKVSGDVVDMTKPGDYKQRLTYTYVFQGKNKTVTSDYVVTVKEDKTDIKAINTTYYQGETFDFKNGFVGAWDKDGNELPFNEEFAWIGGEATTIDMNTPGVTSVFYGLKNADNDLAYRNQTVTVLKDQSSLKTKPSTVYVGDIWNKKDNFVSATDMAGEPVEWASSAISTNGSKVDTSKPGTHKITYTYKGKFKSVDSTFTVDVIERPLEISVPDVVDFGKYSLGTRKTKLYWDDKNRITITDSAKKGWELSVQVKTNTDFSNYVYHQEQLVGTERIVIDEGKGNKVVSDELLNEELIYIDYTDAKSLRTDQATFEWNVTPSIKGVSE